MKKKLVALFAAALLTVSFAGNALAAFTNTELIRVVYDTVGSKEYATDLGSWATLSTAGANTIVGGGTDAITLANTGAAAWGNLVVGYFMVDSTAGALKVAVAADGVNAITSGARKFNGINGNASAIYSNYVVSTNAIAGTNSSVIADKANSANTFYNLFDAAGVSKGYYSGWETGATGVNPGGILSLAALTTTGYVDQTMVFFNVLALQNVATTGTNAFTVRTMADGSTVINPGAAAPVPVPPAFFLMGSGLLGMFGIRRKKNA